MCYKIEKIEFLVNYFAEKNVFYVFEKSREKPHGSIYAGSYSRDITVYLRNIQGYVSKVYKTIKKPLIKYKIC